MYKINIVYKFYFFVVVCYALPSINLRLYAMATFWFFVFIFTIIFVTRYLDSNNYENMINSWV